MAQMGFFDLSDRYASLDAKNDPLAEINEIVPWEDFRPLLEQVWRKPKSERKSRAGRKPMDAVLMFKTLVLGALYNLSDDQVEYQVRDRLSFMRFLGLGLGDRVPDAKTVWLYREALAQAGKVDELFKLFDRHLARPGRFWGVMRKAPKGGKLHPIDEHINRLIAKVRSRLEHPFRVLKRQFGYIKTRYRGLAKNRAQLFSLFAHGNLYLVRKRPMA